MDTDLIRSAGGTHLSDLLTSPDGDLRDAGPKLLDAIRDELNSNFFLFFGFFFMYPEFTVHWHKPICDFVNRWGQPGWKRLCIEIPRDTGKTTTCTKANSLFQVCRSEGHNARVAIFNAKESRAKSWVGAIREFVESNQAFQLLYRDMLPEGVGFTSSRDGIRRGWTWSDSELLFVRTSSGVPEPSISAHGATGAAAGYHFTHIIKDDIIELKHALSELEMQRAKEWIDTARYLESPAEKGNELLVYTRWHFNDVYRHVRTSWPGEYRIFHRPALTSDPATGEETSAFPEKWTTPELFKMRERDPFYFNSQLMLRPQPGREVAFDPQWLRYGEICTFDDDLHFAIRADSYDPTRTLAEDDSRPPRIVPLWQCDKVVLWDPAPSEERDRRQNTSARNGKVALALDPWGRWLILEARGTRQDPVDELFDTILLAMKWSIRKVATEEVNFSKLYRHFANHLLSTEPAFRKADIQFLPQKCPRMEKDTRIRALMPDWREGYIYLNEPESQQLVTEFREYPFGTTRDILDAFAQRAADPKPVSRPETIDEQIYYEEEMQARMEPSISGRDNVTGY